MLSYFARMKNKLQNQLDYSNVCVLSLEAAAISCPGGVPEEANNVIGW